MAALDVFRKEATHGIFLMPGHRPQLSSEALGWRSMLVVVGHEEGPFKMTCNPVGDYLVVLQLKGTTPLHWQVQGKSETQMAFAGSITVVPAEEGFSLDAESETDTAHVYLRRALIDDVILESMRQDPQRFTVAPCLAARDPLLEQLALACVAALRHPIPSTSLYIDKLAWAMAAHLVHTHGPTSKTSSQPAVALQHRQLDRARAYIEENLGRDIGISDLARAAALSPVYFARSFKQAMGLAPHQYLMSARVERVKKMLLSDERTLSDIAALCGFCHQEHMTRVFRRFCGSTPGAYRKSRRCRISIQKSGGRLLRSHSTQRSGREIEAGAL
jgi:AraC family transcriptional regulator